MHSIYCFQGLQEILVSEKFPFSKIKEVQIFVWKSPNGVLGFDNDELSVRFVEEFIGDKITIMFPRLKLIDKKELLQTNINSLRGITFLNGSHLIKKEFDSYLLHERKKQQNSLLARYGKVTETLEIPKIVNWYNIQSNSYTAEFGDFCRENRLDFISWSFSDFGIYFFSFRSIDKEVELLSRKLGIQFLRRDDILTMPYH